MPVPPGGGKAGCPAARCSSHCRTADSAEAEPPAGLERGQLVPLGPVDDRPSLKPSASASSRAVTNRSRPTRRPPSDERKVDFEVTLSTGKTHTLVESTGTTKHAEDALGAFLQRRGLAHSGDWIMGYPCCDDLRSSQPVVLLSQVCLRNGSWKSARRDRSVPRRLT